MIGAEQIARMKDGAILINISRGGIVEEWALVEALKSGKLRGAALDAFTQEPPEPGHLLYKPGLPNLIATPHAAWNTVEAGVKNTEIFVEQLRCIAKGQLPPGLVNPEIGEQWLQRIRGIIRSGPLAAERGRETVCSR
jgi:phosphoglycerate dehydrogenase-like enzyme